MYFDANSGGGGGGKDGNADGDGDANKPKGKTFTQEELDALFAQRAKQAGNSALTDLFKELGVENADSLKAVITKAKEADDANKTELQKALDKVTATEKAFADQKIAHDTAIAELSKRILDSEIKIAAGNEVKDKDGNVLRPRALPDALDVVLLGISRSEIVQKENAYSGIEEALAVLFKSKPFLFEAETEPPTKGTPPGQPPRKPNLQQKQNAASGKHSRF
ncbi:MAG: hypothetical protein IPL32_18135 [Chloracidobacterium sp.]|nr:hypothetical protein [Chloracidobacterium sp.]